MLILKDNILSICEKRYTSLKSKSLSKKPYNLTFEVEIPV